MWGCESIASELRVTEPRSGSVADCRGAVERSEGAMLAAAGLSKNMTKPKRWSAWE